MEELKLGYYYMSKFQEELALIFVFRGSGAFEIGGEIHDTGYLVYGNAVVKD